MDVQKFRQFMELTGHRVIESDNSLWCEMVPMFYENIPFYRCIHPSRDEIEGLFCEHRLLGLKYCTGQGERGKKGFLYLCDTKPYNIDSIHPKMRNKVRQGLQNCVVRQIDFDCLKEHGLPVNRATLKRQNREDRTFSKPNKWAQFCEAGKQVEGAVPWGAFVDDQLAAYAVTFITGEYCNILYQYSRSDLLHTKANNALAYVMTKELLSTPGINYVSYGLSSIRGEQPGLDEYKTRLGYKRCPVNYVVELHPFLKRVLLGELSLRIMNAVCNVLEENDFLKRASGIVEIASCS